MKKRCATILVSAILALSLVACDGGSTASSTTTTPEPTKVVEVTPEPTKEPVQPTEAPTVEPTEAPEEPTEAPTESPDTPEPTEEVSEPTEVEEPTEAPSEIDKFMKNGTFDVELFANDTGASEWYDIGIAIVFVYNGTVFVQADIEESLSDKSSVMIGRWDPSAEYMNVLTYSYLLPTGETTKVSTGATLSKDSLNYLPELVRFVKANGANSAPDIAGTDFRPCSATDGTIQY